MKFLFFILCLFCHSAYSVTLGADGDEVIPLGGGYDPDLDSSTSKCLSGTEVFEGSPQGVLSVDHSISFEELTKKLSLNIEGGDKSAKYQISSKSSFAYESRDSSLSEVYRFVSSFRLKNRVFLHNGYNPIGTSALSSGSGQTFRNVCGTQFLSQIVQGGGLYITIKFNFLSEEDKRRFSTEGGFSSGMIDIKTKLDGEFEQKNFNGTVTIHALQDGGDPSQLLQLVGTGMAQTCDLKKVESCRTTLDALSNYATTFSKGFQGDPQSSVTGPAILGYVLKNYNIVGATLPVIPAIVNQEITDIRADISNKFEIFSNNLALVSNYLSIHERLFFDAEKNALKNIKNDLNFNLNQIKAAGVICWYEPSNCKAANDALSGISAGVFGVARLRTIGAINPPKQVPELITPLGFPFVTALNRIDSPGWPISGYGWSNSGVGMAVFDINNNGKSELIEYVIDNPSKFDSAYYRIGWDTVGGVSSRWELKKIDGVIGYENSGGDLAVGNIDRNTRPDMITVYIDNAATDNYAYYKISWNLSTTGVPEKTSMSIAIPGTLGWESQGAGLALADVNKNGIPDLVFMYIDNHRYDNTAHYRIGWDINENGNPVGGWSGKIDIPLPLGWESQGGGIAIADMDQNGVLDLVFSFIDNAQYTNYGYYSIGYNLGVDGKVAGWSTLHKIISLGWENAGAGISVINYDGKNLPDIIFHSVDDHRYENTGEYLFIVR